MNAMKNISVLVLSALMPIISILLPCEFPNAIAQVDQQSAPVISQEGESANKLTQQGIALLKNNKLAAAQEHLAKAIELWESLPAGKAARPTIALSYQILQKILVAQQNTDAALEISEREKVRDSAELFASKTTKHYVNRYVINLPGKIKRVAKEQNTTLIQYSVVDRSIYIWIITPQGRTSFHQSDIPTGTNLTNLVNTTYSKLADSLHENIPQQELQQLHKLLIAPIAKYLPTDPAALVTIIPTPELLAVPFAALQTQQSKFLIEQHTLAIAPSIMVLGATHSHVRSSGRPPVIIGNPVMPPYLGQTLPSLPGAETEAKTVAKTLGVQSYIGETATRKLQKREMIGSHIVHFATYIMFDRLPNSLLGEIALSDGWLTAKEIYQAATPIDLIVLSGCVYQTTPDSTLIVGDGIAAMSQSFNTDTLMLNLWSFADDDPGVQLFMREFYRNQPSFYWLPGKLGRARPIRQAMLATMKAYPHPHSWAAFTLVGKG
jgi:CHAT domain-containing protein